MPYKDQDKQREYNRKWVANRRREFFADKVCSECGKTTDLELDHIDRQTKVSHSIWSWRQERREAELTKCQVLCADCHKTKTSMENSRPITHGNSGYRRGCRCQICFTAHSERMKLRVR